jgi:mannose-1-phosphate guanylyltransferase
VSFVENPAADLAHLLHRSGTALWNTMVLLGTASAFLERFARELPDLVAAMDALPRRESGEGRFAAAYASLPAANFSADLIGRARDLAVVALPMEAGWTDLGTEPRMLEWLARSAPQVAAVGGELVAQHG